MLCKPRVQFLLTGMVMYDTIHLSIVSSFVRLLVTGGSVIQNSINRKDYVDR